MTSKQWIYIGAGAAVLLLLSSKPAKASDSKGASPTGATPTGNSAGWFDNVLPGQGFARQLDGDGTLAKSNGAKLVFTDPENGQYVLSFPDKISQLYTAQNETLGRANSPNSFDQ